MATVLGIGAAPNRRFADLVTQRLIKSAIAGKPCLYSDDELAAMAKNCTSKEDAERRIPLGEGSQHPPLTDKSLLQKEMRCDCEANSENR